MVVTYIGLCMMGLVANAPPVTRERPFRRYVACAKWNATRYITMRGSVTSGPISKHEIYFFPHLSGIIRA